MTISDIMISIIELTTPSEVQMSLAQECKRARLDHNHSRGKAALLSGVPVATIRQFETTGKISLGQFLMLCNVYGQLSNCVQLFPEPQPRTIEELIDDKPQRQRGRK